MYAGLHSTLDCLLSTLKLSLSMDVKAWAEAAAKPGLLADLLPLLLALCLLPAEQPLPQLFRLLLLPALVLQLLDSSSRLLRLLLALLLRLALLLLLVGLQSLSLLVSVPLLNSSACIRSTFTKLLGRQVMSTGSMYCPSS